MGLSGSWAKITYKVHDLKLGQRGRIRGRIEQWKTEGGKKKKGGHLRRRGAEFWIEQEIKAS